MALTERDRGRLRNVVDTLMRADDVVMDITDEHALKGPSAGDDDLDALHDLLTQALERLEKLLAHD